MKNLSKIGIALLVFALLIAPTLLLSHPIGGQTNGAAGPMTSAGSMQGVTPERTRVYSAGMDEPKSVLWQSERLFYLKEANSFSMSGGGYTFFGWTPTGYSFSNPIASGGLIYFTLSLDDAFLFSLDATNGKSKTKLRLKGTRFSAPAIAGDLLFAGTEDGNLMAISRTDGKTKWAIGKKEYRFDVSSPVVAGGVVYFGGATKTTNNINGARGNGIVAAIDALTGEGRWVFPLKGFPTAAAIIEDTMIFGDEDSHLFGVNRRTGMQTWVFKTDGNVIGPAISGDFVYFIDEGGRLYSVNAETGALAWKSDKSRQMDYLLAADEGTLYCAGKGRNVYAVDAASGKQKWEFKTTGQCNSPIIAGGVVYFLSVDKYFYAVDASDGQQKWRYKMPHNAFSAPIITNGIAYLLDEDGYMYAIK